MTISKLVTILDEVLVERDQPVLPLVRRAAAIAVIAGHDEGR